MVHLIISVPLPQILEQIAEMMKVIQQEQISKRIVEQIVDVPVPQIPEQIVDMPVPQVMEETVEAAKSIPQERVQQRTLEETVGVLVLLEVLAASRAVPSREENGRSPRRALPTALRSGGAAALSSRSVDIIAAGPSGVNKHAIHDNVCIVSGRWFFLQVRRRLRRCGCCCAARTSVLQLTCWGARKTHAMISPYRPFFFLRVLLLLSSLEFASIVANLQFSSVCTAAN